jgi:hypothetical protein
VRIAYVVVAHHLPRQVCRLVRALHTPDTSFYVHIDRRAGRDCRRRVARDLATVPRVRMLPSHRCHWAGFSILRAELKGLHAALEGGDRFDHLVILSGQDYPVASNARIAERLALAGGDSFLQHSPLPDPAFPHDANRYERWHVPAWDYHLPNERIRLPVTRRMPLGMTPFRGLAFGALSRRAALHVRAVLRDEPRVLRFFRTVYAPDEMMFQTILLNSPLAGTIRNEPLHHTDWSADGSSPATIGPAGLDAAVRSGMLFARKFDEGRDPGILDRLESLREPDGRAGPAR